MPDRRAGEIHFWVPGNLHNYANKGGYYGGRAEATYRKRWREKAHVIGLLQPAWRGPALAKEPKRVVLRAQVWNLFDEQDGLRNALKPVVDGLVDAGLLHSDGPASGHTFIYEQRVNRKERGVRITIAPREGP